jgi:hypothetical protein
LIAEVLGSNLAMLKVFEKSGLHMITKREGSVVHVTLKLRRHKPIEVQLGFRRGRAIAHRRL